MSEHLDKIKELFRSADPEDTEDALDEAAKLFKKLPLYEREEAQGYLEGLATASRS